MHLAVNELIVFLDLEGPLFNHRAKLAGFHGDPVAASIVSRLLSLNNVKLVLSSTDRALVKTVDSMIVHLKKRYNITVDKFNIHSDWCTAPINGLLRREEITDWIVKNGQDHYEYLSIDDEPTYLYHEHPLDREKTLYVDRVEANIYEGINFSGIYKIYSYIEKYSEGVELDVN